MVSVYTYSVPEVSELICKTVRVASKTVKTFNKFEKDESKGSSSRFVLGSSRIRYVLNRSNGTCYASRTWPMSTEKMHFKLSSRTRVISRSRLEEMR